MTDVPQRPISPVVRWLAVALVFAALVLLTLGGLTTSFRAGMADPVWPTAPWFLIVNGKEYFHEQYTGFLLEHTHRLAGFTVGALAAVVAVAAWLSGPFMRPRRFGLIAIVMLLGGYGWFHGQMMAAKDVVDKGGEFHWPVTSGVATLAAAVALLVACGVHVAGRQPGRWVRAVAGTLLVAVMVQGLLGGFRVFLDARAGLKGTLGVELSQLHGVFAQVVFALMALLPTLAATRQADDALEPTSRARLVWLTLALPVAVFVQLVWAVWVRHAPTPLAQRLHMLTAFVVVGLAVWLAVRAVQLPDARRLLRFSAYHLLAMLAVQVLLGVEAWMGKFAVSGEAALVPVELRTPTVAHGVLRTLHQLIGTAVLASSVALAFRVWRRPVPVPANEAVAGRLPDPQATAAVPEVAAA